MMEFIDLRVMEFGCVHVGTVVSLYRIEGGECKLRIDLLLVNASRSGILFFKQVESVFTLHIGHGGYPSQAERQLALFIAFFSKTQSEIYISA